MIKKLHFKTLLLMAVMLLGAGTAWAEETTETLTMNTTAGYNELTVTKAGTSGSGSELEISKGNIVVTSGLGYIKDHEMTIYKTGSMTVSLSNVTGYITKVELTVKNYHFSPNASPEGWTAGDNYDTDTKDDKNDVEEVFTTTATDLTSITLNNVSNGKTTVKVIKVTYVTDGIATPTFSPAAGTYTSAQSVTISTTTADADIYYTIDGSEPTVESTKYTEPIAVNTTTTIKAIAVKDGLSSDVAEATFTIDLSPVLNVEPTSVTVASDGGTGELALTATNFSFSDVFWAGFTFYELIEGSIGGGKTPIMNSDNNPTWIHLSVSDDYSTINYTVDKNESSEPRTAYVVLDEIFRPDSKQVTSDMFEITQEAYVVDYAELPFEFNGGRSDIATTTGLTQEGLDSDYSSSPKLKFNGTGDWMILKINEAPGKLTFDIKGNSFSGGTFTVQTSADGVTYTDLKAYTAIDNNKAQSETLNNLAEDVRFIKWIYTKKSSGNVGLGNIKLEKPSTVPVITVADATVNINGNFQDITRDVTYENLSITDMTDFDIQYYSDAECENGIDEPEWIEALVAGQDPSIGEGYVLSCIVDKNDGEERTAYLKVYAMVDETNLIYSNLVTITQAKYVETVDYTLATTITPGKHYIIASGTTGEVYVMGGQKSTNRDAVKVNITTENVISITEDVEIREFIVSKDGAYYTFFDFDKTNNGYLYAAGGTGSNHLKTQNVNNDKGQWSIFIDDEGIATVKANITGEGVRNWMRYNSSSKIFSCYSSGQQDIYLFEKDNDEGSLVIPIAAACTDGTKCYGTFSSTQPFVVPEGLTVSEIAIQSSVMNVQDYESGAVVPANTGVMVSAAEGDRSYVVNVSTEEGEDILDGTNALRPTGDDGITADEMAAADESCMYYRLTMHKKNNDEKIIGFWWGAENGAAFEVAANKAYMVVPAITARQGYTFGGDATGIANINASAAANDCYNLQGQRVENPVKGLYIVNGKKVVVK